MIKILFLMLLCHIIDDFVLQTKFSYLKQKSWWIKACQEDNLPIEKYKNDYKMAVFEHSLEWSIVIIIPVMLFYNVSSIALATIILINTIIHYIVDNAKANQLRLNLIQDQILHFLQIIITFLALII